MACAHAPCRTKSDASGFPRRWRCRHSGGAFQHATPSPRLCQQCHPTAVICPSPRSARAALHLLWPCTLTVYVEARDEHASARSRDRAAASRREVADRHHRDPVARAPRDGAPGACPGRCAGSGERGACVTDRSVPGVSPRDAHGVPDDTRHATLYDGARARLPRGHRSLPHPDRAAAATTRSGGVSAPAHAPGRTGTSRLGTLCVPRAR